MTAVSGAACGATFAGFNASRAADQLMSKGDANTDGALSFDEFNALDQSSATQQAGGTVGAKGMSDLFKAIDTDSDGSLTKDELTSFGQKLSDRMRTAMFEAQASAGGQGASFGGTGSGAASSSSGSDPLDTNKDGVVSLMERLAAADGSNGSDASGPNSSNARIGQFLSLLAASGYQNTNSATPSATSLFSAVA